MITKNDLRYYSSLLKKKYRFKERKFLAEGIKIIEEGLKSNYVCETVFVTNDFYENRSDFLESNVNKNIRVEVLKKNELQRLTDTITPQGIAAAFNIPDKKELSVINSNLIICLENISDPGNLGSIIRTCDWFGIETVLLSENTVDAFNPKVIRGSMGSIFHLDIMNEINIDSLGKLKEKDYKLVCSDLTGISINDFTLPDKTVLIFSNEASGPSELILKKSDFKVTIPKIGKGESLNVSAAAAIILSQITK